MVYINEVMDITFNFVAGLNSTLLGQAAPDEAASETQDGLIAIIFSGGWIGLAILLLLFALSVSAAYLVFDQVMTLRRIEVLPEGLSETVRQALLTGRLAEADAACRREPSVLGYILLNGLAEIDFGWHEVEKAVEDGLADQAARLMRRIEYLSVIGNIAPMVGLLGTVTGMIFAFQEVAGSQGAAGAGDLAEGIYQALVTTVGGLIVAIPSLAAYAVCRNRVDSLVAEAAYQSLHALTPIKRPPSKPKGPSRGPAAKPPIATSGAQSAAPPAPPASVRPAATKPSPRQQPPGEPPAGPIPPPGTAPPKT